jgi:hypothetical protein
MEKKEQSKEPPKKRAEKYEEKVKFDGSLEQMINIAIKTPPANKPK